MTKQEQLKKKKSEELCKEQQIEEMATAIMNYADKYAWGLIEFECENLAIVLHNLGYRKIDDDCAVITKAELKQYKVQAVKEFAEKLKAMCSDYLYDKNFDGKNDFDIHIGELSRMIDELLKEYEK